MILFVLLLLFLYMFYRTIIVPSLYWNGRGIEHVNLYLSTFRVFFTKKSFHEIIRQAYTRFPNARYYGGFEFLKPTLVPTDLDLINHITTKHFQHFHDHRSFTDPAADPILSQNLFALKGQEWKNMRATLTPAFTGSKMKKMFHLMVQVAENFTNYHLAKCAEGSIELEMKQTCSKFSNDVIASCAFGVECDSMEDGCNKFMEMGKVISEGFDLFRTLRAIFIGFFPYVAKTFKMPMFPNEMTAFFRDLVSTTIAYREKENIVRPDMIHLLMQAKKGELCEANLSEEAEINSVEDNKETGQNLDNIDLFTAQVFVFYLAGFNAVSTALSFVFYQLAIHPDIQERLYQEIMDGLEQTNGKLEYESVMNMKYLGQVLSETLRLCPPSISLNRVCTKDFLIPAKLPHEKDIVIEKGCNVVIPVYGIHMHPKFFPNPEKFDPERFSDENKSSILPGSYLPFGYGPRICIGNRFALLEIKTLIVEFLSKFKVKPVARTQIPLTFAKSIIVKAKDGVWVGLEKRNI